MPSYETDPNKMTPKDRAEDLREAGLKLEKLPSFKRDEWIVRCPECGKRASFAGSGSMLWVGDDLADPYVRDRKVPDRVRLVDSTFVTGIGTKHKVAGGAMWRLCRLHALSCTNDVLDDEKRYGAIEAAHELRRKLAAAPEMRSRVMQDLADYVLAPLGLRIAADAVRQTSFLEDPDPIAPLKHEREAAEKAKTAEGLKDLNALMGNVLAGAAEKHR